MHLILHFYMGFFFIVSHSRTPEDVDCYTLNGDGDYEDDDNNDRDKYAVCENGLW